MQKQAAVGCRVYREWMSCSDVHVSRRRRLTVAVAVVCASFLRSLAFQAQQPQRRDQPLALLAPQLHQPKHHQYWPKLQHQHQWCRQPHRRQHCKQPRPCKEHRYLRCERQRQHCMFKSQQQCSASPSLQRLLWSQALPQWQSLWRWSNRPKCQLPSWHQSRLYRLRLSQKQGFRRPGHQKHPAKRSKTAKPSREMSDIGTFETV